MTTLTLSYNNKTTVSKVQFSYTSRVLSSHKRVRINIAALLKYASCNFFLD